MDRKTGCPWNYWQIPSELFMRFYDTVRVLQIENARAIATRREHMFEY